MLEATPVNDWHAQTSRNAGVSLEICQFPTIWQAIASNVNVKAFPEIFKSATGRTLPDRPAAIGGQPCIIWGGPGRWFFVADTPAEAMAALCRAGREAGAATIDQSGGWLLARLSGPNRRDLLSKGVNIDLHPATFSPGMAAMTLLHEIGIILWRPEADPETFMVMVRRSFARSFRNWFEVSAAEFGFRVTSASESAVTEKTERRI